MSRRSSKRVFDEAQAHQLGLAARPTTSGWGKCNRRVSALVNDEIADELGRWWRERGYGSESDAIREILVIALRGKEALKKMHVDRIESAAQHMAGIGS